MNPADEDVPDRSNGWEAVAATIISDTRRSTTGAAKVSAWAETLPSHASVVDLGCGPGTPRSEELVRRGFALYAIDAAPSLAAAYQRRFPHAHVICEAAEDSAFFGRTFDGVLAWGLMFLLSAESQKAVIHRVARALKPGGRLLFTAPAQACTWADLSTGRESRSLGAAAYETILGDAGFALKDAYDDEGENHYYDAERR